jgi:XTP/dITP diphosphohydrolase
LKAHYVKEKYGLDCFSEDTGLEVIALKGAPGVHTARYAGDHKSHTDNIQLLLKNLKGKANRKAQFRTVICLLMDGKEILLEGVCEGRIAAEITGSGGFGYDPIFIPKGYKKTFAQLGDKVKNVISHRGKATQLLIKAIDS